MSPQHKTNLPCVDNVAFGMERIGRSQTSGSQRMALVDLSNEASISMEPLRPSGGPQGVPSDGELTPHTGEINIAVTSKSRPVFALPCIGLFVRFVRLAASPFVAFVLTPSVCVFLMHLRKWLS